MYSRNIEPEEDTCQIQDGFLRLRQEENRSDALALNMAGSPPTGSARTLNSITEVGCAYENDDCRQSPWLGQPLSIFCDKQFFDESTCKCSRFKHCHIAFTFEYFDTDDLGKR